MKNKFAKVLSQPMDRKTFLKKVGAASLVVIGFGGVAKVFTEDTAQNSNNSARGYGNGGYGV